MNAASPLLRGGAGVVDGGGGVVGEAAAAEGVAEEGPGAEGLDGVPRALPEGGLAGHDVLRGHGRVCREGVKVLENDPAGAVGVVKW